MKFGDNVLSSKIVVIHASVELQGKWQSKMVRVELPNEIVTVQSVFTFSSKMLLVRSALKRGVQITLLSNKKLCFTYPNGLTD